LWLDHYSNNQQETVVRKITLSLCGGLVLAAAFSATAETVDAKLLGMLRDNGSITPAQYTELSTDLANEQKAAPASAPVNKKDFDDLQQKIAWAANTVVSGDIRVRQENISIENNDPERNQDRQRVRARVAVVSQVSPDVEAGVRIASGNSNDARSTNQDLNNYFTKKDLWLDRAYVNYHPTEVPGLKVVGGKMAQPWVNVDEMIWDGDVNPEGIASLYSHKFGPAELFGSTGAFTLKDNVNGNGVQFTDDLRLISAQVGVRFTLADNYKFMAGGSLYHYHLDGDSPVVPPATLGLSANGNTSTQFQLYEGFTQLDITGLPVPLTFWGQYVKNPNANGPQSDNDMGWLAGFKTKIWNISLLYSYRDVQRNAVVGAFTDSDFADGFTGSRGSKFQIQYPISKNFMFSTQYFMTQSNAVNAQSGSDVDTWLIDFVASF
jgi:hypothetical protein